MSFEEVVLGFDVRVDPASVAAAWDDERRDGFLLDPEAVTSGPLSVDEAVWPRPGTRLDGGKLEIETPKYASLEDALAAAGPDDAVVAISQWRGPGEPELPVGPTWPMRVDPDWERLGWDIVSGVFPSGVSNCGYPPDQVLDWRARWTGRFNRHHLFDDLPTAFAFRDATNRRVAEHAPFAVQGLYLVRGPRPRRA